MGKVGVGMPHALLLEAFGEQVYAAFGEVPYQVGSSLTTTAWRDVDVRLMLDDDAYAAMGFGDPDRPHSNMKWVAYTLAFSALGKQMTGLPIDFQIQQTSHANAKNDGGRSALGIRSAMAKRAAQDDPAPAPTTQPPIDAGVLWAFLRGVLLAGVDIYERTEIAAGMTERISAAIDAKASEFTEAFLAKLPETAHV